jgi:hypothetical protein
MKNLCTIILAGCSLLFAAEERNDRTFGLENGRLWTSLQPDYRPVFHLGIVHGWQLRANTEEVMKGKVINAFASSGNFYSNELADLVTSVYADTENVALPIGWVVLASLAVERGQVDRNTVLTALRKQMTDLLNGKRSRPNTDYDPLETILASRIH